MTSGGVPGVLGVLVVDDDPDIARLYAMALGSLGDVTAVQSGADALTALAESERMLPGLIDRIEILVAHIGLAGQYAAVDENLSGFENLEMVGRLYHLGAKASRQRAVRC